MFYSSFAITVTSSHTPAHDIMKPIIKDFYRNDWKMTQMTSSVWNTFHLIKCVKSGHNQPVMSFQVVICSHVTVTQSMHCILHFLMNNEWASRCPLSSYLFTALNPPVRQWRSSVRSITDQHEHSSKELFFGIL